MTPDCVESGCIMSEFATFVEKKTLIVDPQIH
jgi:hypothetical protein